MSFTGTLSDFYPVLVAAVGEAQKVNVGTNKMLDAVYKKIDPLPGPVGSVVNVPIPAKRTSTNIGAGSFTFNAPTTQYNNSIAMSSIQSDAFVIPALDQYQTPEELRTIYLDPAIKAVLTGINADVITDTASLAGNGSTTAVNNDTGGISGYFTVPQFLALRATLASNLVDVGDVGNMSWVQNEFAYHNQLDDTDWVKQTSVGQSIAQSIRSSGEFPIAFQTELSYDQGFASTGTGSTLSYPGAYFHRFAIALATRPQPVVASNDYLKVLDLPIRGLVFRIMMWFDPLANGYRCTVSCMYGHACVRPDMGIQTTANVTL